MTIACIFSGQGAQYEGMGRKLAAADRNAARIYEACSDYLGFDVLALTADQLKQTRYAQPATVVLSLAAFEVVRAARPDWQPDMMAGFSLGEYAMLGASGVLRLESLMHLLNRRSDYMQDACDSAPGAMYAILGLNDETVAACCAEAAPDGSVIPANYNSPGQLVISGAAPAAAAVAEACRAAGARRVVQLAVAGAFHTPMMQPAADRLAAFAAALPFGQPVCALYSNVTGGLWPADAGLPAYLADHMVSPVRWTAEVGAMARSGASDFIEFGPGKTLCGLIRKIDRSLNVSNAEDPETCAEAVRHLPL